MIRTYIVQSVILPRSKFTLNSAIQWVINNGFKVMKVNVTKSYYRVRQKNPITGVKTRLHSLPNGVKLVVEFPQR